MIDKEFEDLCLKEKIKKFEPSVIYLKTPIEKERESKKYKIAGEYFLKGASSLIDSESPLLSIILGYFAIEHKANEILAKKGYKF